MGGKSSKVETYVCHVDEEKYDQIQLYSSASSKKTAVTSPVSVANMPLEEQNAQSLTRGKSSAKLVKINSSAVLEKQHSIAAINGNRRNSSTNNMNVSTATVSARLERGRSASADFTASSKNPKKVGLSTCSTEYPWLMKNGKLLGQSLKDFEQGRILGRGFMGTVRLTKTKGDKYIVFKCVKKEQVVKKKSHRHLMNEKLVLSTLNSSFCIKLFGTFQDKQYLYFALEFAAGGELCHHLDTKQFFQPEVAKFYISEIFVALEHVQSLGFVYRDLKPENVMLDEEGHCKLVDFGFTTSANSSTGKLHTMCGTAAYLSPEQLDGKFTNGYTNIVDWWSFGVLAYELRTGETPFCRSTRDTNYEIFLRILKKKISFPYSFDKKSKELIKSLCYADPTKRLCDPENIKKHSYFDIPWGLVQDRRLIPPIKPKLTCVGDAHYFPQFHDTEPAAPATPMGSDSQDVVGNSGSEFYDF